MSIERVESQKHQVIQVLRGIQTEKGREQQEAFHVEGLMLVCRALDYGKVRFIVCTERFAISPESSLVISAAAKAEIKVYQVTEGLMGKVVPGKPVPPVVAVVERSLYPPSKLFEGTDNLLILIDQCENPDNLGMLLRSLDAAGVDGVAITSDSTDPFHRLCVRASRGAVFSLKLAIVKEPEQWIMDAKKNSYKVIASSAHGADSFWKTDMTGQVILVVGNEHTGIRQSIKDTADALVYIPMSGRMESLNIAVAGAVLAYEAIRQRTMGET